MSGIEAVFGAVASGAGLLSLSIQLAESAMKLKRIHDAAKDAPRTISALIADLETLAMALQQIEQSRQQGFSADALLARCITGCQTSTAEIRRLVDKMEDYVKTHSKLGRLYSAFRDRHVQTLLNRLEQAKRSLQLAYTLYRAEEEERRYKEHSSMLAQQCALLHGLQGHFLAGHASLSQQLSLLPRHNLSPIPAGNDMIPAPSRSSAAGTICDKASEGTTAQKTQVDTVSRGAHPSTRRPRESSRKTFFRASVRLPTWLSRQIFELAAFRAEWGLDVQLRTFNVVPHDAPIFEYCRKGNLAGVRRLIESGSASLLDVSDDQWTVLDVAGNAGHVELCKYFLAHAVWPDQGALMTRVLNWFGNLRYIRVAELYRIFLAEPTFDADLDGLGKHERWFQLCDDLEVWEIILQNQPLDFHTRPIEYRFGIAASLLGMDVTGFLKCIQLQPSDSRLASVKNCNGKTILHHIAHRLSYSSLSFLHESGVEAWFALGCSVLRHKADLLGALERVEAEDSKVWWSTPLMECMAMTPEWKLSHWDHDTSQMVMHKLYLWVEMVRLAGLDLLSYGEQENDRWNSLGIQSAFKFEAIQEVKVVQLVYGPTPADWGLKISHSWGFKIYRLQHPPGAFSSERAIPSKLAWTPTLQEQDEGPWTMEERRIHVGECHVVKSLDSTGFSDMNILIDEPFTEIIDGTQDDTGVIMLMQDRVSRAQRIPARSHSQPACLRRREVAYYGRLQAHTRQWLPRYHLCPSDSRWRVGCIERFVWHEPMEAYDSYAMLADNTAHGVFHVRSCVKEFCSNLSSLQQSGDWYWKSFLGEIAVCKNSVANHKRTGGLRHTGSPNCPHGCVKVHLSRMNVPESLREYHPGPAYGDDDEDEVDNDAI